MDRNLNALANAIIEEYNKRIEADTQIKSLMYKAIEEKSFQKVYTIAKRAGLNLETALINQWSFSEDEVFFDTMKNLLSQIVAPMHEDIGKTCAAIQTKMNSAAKIKLKAQTTPINEYDLGDIAARMKNKGITQISGELQTLGCKMVDDNQQANMELQTSVGYEIVVTRKYDSIGLRRGTKYSERCKVCVGLEGSHQFRSTREARNSGVFARHPGCGCVIDYYSKRTGTVTKGVQNYNTAKISHNKQNNVFSRSSDVEKNLDSIEKLYIQGNTSKVNQNIENFEKKSIIHSTISSPITQRNTGKGNPNAVVMYDLELNNRQKDLLDKLPYYDSRVLVEKNAIDLKDIAALTAKTGDEFAIFTNGSRRLIVRGDTGSIGIPDYELMDMGTKGYRLTGHTHPGVDRFCLFPSEGDKLALRLLKQKQSVIYNSRGQFITFDLFDEE